MGGASEAEASYFHTWILISLLKANLLIPKVFFEFQFNFILAVCKTKVTTVR